MLLGLVSFVWGWQKQTRARLLSRLQKPFRKARGEAHSYGLYPPKDWGKNTTALLTEGAQKHLKKHLDDDGLAQFLTHELEKELRLAGDSRPAEETKIVAISALSDPLSIAKKFTDRLSSLPRQYRLLVRGPAELSLRLNRADIDIKMSDQLRLVSGLIISSEFSLEHPNSDFDSYIRGGDGAEKPIHFEDKLLYFEYRCSGVVSRIHGTKIVRDFFDVVRAFYGSCMALKIIGDFDYKNANISPWVAANELIQDSGELCFISRADDDIIKATNLTTTGALDKKIDKGDGTLEEWLQPICDMLSSKESLKLITASIWIFRANISARQMDRILESTIALEVLLGDRETSDRIGLSKLMANRCAYALGSSSKERKEITDFFVEFYKVRSEIVHSGKFKLEEDDGSIVQRGFDLAERMLRHEIKLSKEN